MLRAAATSLVALLLVAAVLLLAFDRLTLAGQTETAEASAPTSGQMLRVLPLDPAFGRVFVQQWGPSDATPVVIAPGAGAWSGFWADTARALAAGGYRVVAVDLPPFGYSDRDAGTLYSRADQAARLIGVLDELDVCEGVLIGHSESAAHVLEALLRYPHRLTGAVLISARVDIRSDGEAMAEPAPLAAILLGHAWTTRIMADALANPWLTGRFLSSQVARDGAVTRERIEILQRPLRRTGTTSAYAQWLAAQMSPDTEALSLSDDSLRRIERPVALLWGDDDTVTPLQQGERLAQLIPGATLDRLPGVGHAPHVEAPDETVSLLRRQLARISPDAMKPAVSGRLETRSCGQGLVR